MWALEDETGHTLPGVLGEGETGGMIWLEGGLGLRWASLLVRSWGKENVVLVTLVRKGRVWFRIRPLVCHWCGASFVGDRRRPVVFTPMPASWPLPEATGTLPA